MVIKTKWNFKSTWNKMSFITDSQVSRSLEQHAALHHQFMNFLMNTSFVSFVCCMEYYFIIIIYYIVPRVGMHLSSLRYWDMYHLPMQNSFGKMVQLWFALSAITHCWLSGDIMSSFKEVGLLHQLTNESITLMTTAVMCVVLQHTEYVFVHYLSR